jgi:hypothetical protein
MQLGALIARLENESDASRMIEALGDLVLYSRVSAAAEHYGETPGQYLAASAGQFATSGGDEEWLGLVAAVERSEDPGRAAISRILSWALLRESPDADAGVDDCSCSG